MTENKISETVSQIGWILMNIKGKYFKNFAQKK